MYTRINHFLTITYQISVFKSQEGSKILFIKIVSFVPFADFHCIVFYFFVVFTLYTLLVQKLLYVYSTKSLVQGSELYCRLHQLKVPSQYIGNATRIVSDPLYSYQNRRVQL